MLSCKKKKKVQSHLRVQAPALCGFISPQIMEEHINNEEGEEEREGEGEDETEQNRERVIVCFFFFFCFFFPPQEISTHHDSQPEEKNGKIGAPDNPILRTCCVLAAYLLRTLCTKKKIQEYPILRTCCVLSA